MTHCGWSNYETWAVNLWLTNDANSDAYWRQSARVALAEAPNSKHVKEWNFRPAEAARIRLADELREAVREAAPLAGATLYVDLLTASLGEVDWYEIAVAWLADLFIEDNQTDNEREEDACV